MSDWGTYAQSAESIYVRQASFTLGYFATDHIAAELEMSIPPTFDLEGTGTLSQYGKIGEAKQWNPTLLFKYFLMAPRRISGRSSVSV